MTTTKDNDKIETTMTIEMTKTMRMIKEMTMETSFVKSLKTKEIHKEVKSEELQEKADQSTDWNQAFEDSCTCRHPRRR